MTLTALSYAPAHWIPMPTDSLTPQEAGALIRQRRLERGLTQDQLVERTGLSSQSYLSALEKGRYHIGKSDHFPAVARELRLSEEDIRLINPSAVFATPSISDEEVEIDYSASARGWKVPKQVPPPIPDALLDAVALYGDNTEFAGIKEYRWQRWMTDSPHKKRPSTPEEWLGFYLSVKDRFNPKEPEE
jgi:transcriptional regulator with XRE-family HTH domain